MIKLVSQERKGWPQLPSPGTLTSRGLAAPKWLSTRLARSQAGSRRSLGKLQPEIACASGYEHKHPRSYLPQARSGPLGPLWETWGLRQGNGLNILFCFVPFSQLERRPTSGMVTGGLTSRVRSHVTATTRQLDALPWRRVPWKAFFFFFFPLLGGTGRIRQMEGEGKGMGGMVHQPKTDGHSV